MDSRIDYEVLSRRRFRRLLLPENSPDRDPSRPSFQADLAKRIRSRNAGQPEDLAAVAKENQFAGAKIVLARQHEDADRVELLQPDEPRVFGPEPL